MVLLYLPLAYLLSRWWDEAGVFAGAALANALSGVLAWWWFRRLLRRSAVSTPARSRRG
jgi:Na+-driven multidrug efflux pump